jgi:hypothetical protein
VFASYGQKRCSLYNNLIMRPDIPIDLQKFCLRHRKPGEAVTPRVLHQKLCSMQTHYREGRAQHVRHGEFRHANLIFASSASGNT